MGCLKNVTRAIFLTIIITGFVAIGGQRWLKDQFINFVNPSKDVVLERAQKVGDFSKINKEFEIEKAAGTAKNYCIKCIFTMQFSQNTKLQDKK